MASQRDDCPTVLVTGANGFLGRAVIAALRDDFDVVALDVCNSGSLPSDVAWLECDLTDAESTHKALERAASHAGGRFASVVHLAAYSDFSGEPSPLYDELTVEGTRRLLATLRSLAPEVEQFVFSSSLLVMAPADDGGVLDEQAALHAAWDYPLSKLGAERVIREEHGGIPAVILRIGSVYDDDCHSIPLAQQIRRIHQKQLESFLFPGDASHGQAFVHVEDVAACVRLAVWRRDGLADLEVFLVGEPETLSYRELQHAIGRALYGRRWPTLRIPAPLAKAGAWLLDRWPGTEPFIQPWMIDLAEANRPISIKRARRRLTWQPQHRLRDAIPRMIEALRRDPEAWYRRNGLGD